MSGPQPFAPMPWKAIPWHIEEGAAAVRCSDGWLVCSTSTDADAAAIVHRMNNWDALVEALDFMLNVSRSVSGFSPMAREQAEKALAKARGEA